VINCGFIAPVLPFLCINFRLVWPEWPSAIVAGWLFLDPKRMKSSCAVRPDNINGTSMARPTGSRGVVTGALSSPAQIQEF
jgi:hypothetical protein